MPSPLRHPVVILGACLVAATGLRAVESPNYETQIRPILKEHCTHCHGEEEKPKGGVDLRLRRFMDGKTEDGSPMLTPGRSRGTRKALTCAFLGSASALVRAITRMTSAKGALVM